MPLNEELRSSIDTYCKRDLPGDLDWHVREFAFVQDVELRKRLGRAFYTARYIGKLMEALNASKDEIHPFIKFQIMQYASIYEAVISYLLWERFKSHPEVQRLQTHKAYKPVQALGSATKMLFVTDECGTEELFTCVYRSARTPKTSIPFKEKVDCAVRIGFLDERYAEEIKHIYQLRNLAHIETEAEKQIEVELAHSKNAYWRMKPFLVRITETLGENVLAD